MKRKILMDWKRGARFNKQWVSIHKATIVVCALGGSLLLMSLPAHSLFEGEDGPFPREGECNINDPLFDNVRNLLGPDNNIGPGTLKGQPVPEPEDIGDYVLNRKAAIELGKALFWDMQVGSDGMQACASCHFRAGADPRSKNQTSFGGNQNADSSFTHAPNSQLTADDFPFHELADPTDRSSFVSRESDDVVSSMGVSFAKFMGVKRGVSQDKGEPISDPVFNVNGQNTRRVEQRNTPTMINAVFNHRNFWDGRADPIFNGVNEHGARDPDAQVLRATGHFHLEWVTLRIDNSSLASQAVGPPVSNFEMSFVDRPFRDIGKKLVSARPLALQQVHPHDSVLGSLADGQNGLRTSYREMIQLAFHPEWWESDLIVEIDQQSGEATFEPLPPDDKLKMNQYTMMEHNFSLFFGLAVQMYEATLVSDDAKIDQHFDSLAAGGLGVLDERERRGLELFEAGGCSDCHSGPEFTSASVRTAKTGFFNPAVEPQFQPPEQIERMFIGSCDIAIYDQGFYNIGIRPFEEDLGVSVDDPFGNPLSIAKLRTMNPNDVPSQELLTIEYPNLMDTGAVPAMEQDERTAVEGAFKIPGLRNVELTAPYFHSGGYSTLKQVVQFYNRGGDFHDHIGTTGQAQDEFIDLVIGRLELTEEEIDLIVAFLGTLTDERVRAQAAPFDHPELIVPNGHTVDDGGGRVAKDNLLVVPAVGADGGPLPAGFLE